MDQTSGQIREIKFELDSKQKKVEQLIIFVNSLTDKALEYNGNVIAAKGAVSIKVHGRVTWNAYQGE